MTRAYELNFCPKIDHGRVNFPPPPPAALKDTRAADEWYDESVRESEQYRCFPTKGMPILPEHNSRIFALSKTAKPATKMWITTIINCNGKLHSLDQSKPISARAKDLLCRMVGFLSPDNCRKGNFCITVSNGTLSDEMGLSPRHVIRLLKELHDAGFIFRHFGTGDIGVTRKCIDLSPLVARLGELADAIADRAQNRAAKRSEREKCATMPEMTRGDDNNVTLNTDKNLDTSESVEAMKEERPKNSAPSGLPTTKQTSANPVQKPSWQPKSSQVVDNCPSIAAYLSTPYPDWPAVVAAASALAARFDLNQKAWVTLCAYFGREWAAITVAIVAEMPPAAFTRSAPTIEQKRAAYLGGIARKLGNGEDVGITATWFRHIKSKAQPRPKPHWSSQ
jgi:hypothetical protein